MKQVAVLQSNYIPWKGYFDIINAVDEFIWYDDVQYTKNDWRNRNRIKTSHGTQWLTVPCGSSGSRNIDQVELRDPRWQRTHWKTISQAYARAPHFPTYRDFFAELYLGRRWNTLCELNHAFVESICREILHIETRFRSSSDYELPTGRNERLLDLLVQVDADRYLSGPTAAKYIDEPSFQDRGIGIDWMDYSGYPIYPQLHGGFEHQVTVLDLLFHVGADAEWYIWGWREGRDLTRTAANRRCHGLTVPSLLSGA